MSRYFDLFPKIAYNIEGKLLSNYQITTNIFFRLGIIKKVLNNASAYYYHIISDSETPEIIAEAIYNDPEAHWIVLLANDIIDAQYDWPLTDRSFHQYITDKYGSIAAAKIGIHHYEKVIQREESFSGSISETRFVINQMKLTDNALGVPYDYYQGDGSLAETQSVNTYDMGDGKTVIETVYRDAISFYDWEVSENEKKRTIKIIKPEYYPQIIGEFNSLTNNRNAPYLRKLV